MALDPVRSSEVRDAIALAAAEAQAKLDSVTIRRADEVNPSDPVVFLAGQVQGKAETKKLRVTVTVKALVDPPEDRERA